MEKVWRRTTTSTPELISRAHPKSGTRTTTLLANCPKGSVKVAGFQAEFVVTADTEFGVVSS